MNVAEQIRDRLEAQLHPQFMEIVDDGAKHIGHAHEGSGHFTVRVTAAAFTGKSRVQRHRLIYAALEPLLHNGVHALSIKAAAPEETVSV